MINQNRLQNCCRNLIRWYDHGHRDLPWRHNRTPYRILVSEIMLQQTRVDTVLRYYDRFLEHLPDFAALADASEETLMTLWQGLGYYRRVRNLQKAARQIMEEHRGCFPEDYDAIRKLAGIGEYTAGAISSIAFNLPYPAVDGNVIRVFSRLNAENLNAPAIRQALLPVYANTQERNTLTQALMELGATVCMPGGAPACLICPWRDDCRAHAARQELDYPAPPPKTVRRKQKMTVLILEHDGCIAFRKRTDDAGVLAGMWELPNFPEYLSERQVLNLFPNGVILKTAQNKHIFTHLEWHMRIYRLRLRQQQENLIWKKPGDCPLPTAFGKLLNKTE